MTDSSTGARLRAVVGQWQQRAETCRRLSGETADRPALSRAWHEEAETIDMFIGDLSALLLVSESHQQEQEQNDQSRVDKGIGSRPTGSTATTNEAG